MNTKTTVRPKRGWTARANKGRASKAKTGRRAAAGYRAKVKALFDELAPDRLGDLWRRLYPLPVEPGCELPDRQGIIEDLADFAQVLQPNLEGMDTDQLCWLVDKCGRACEVVGQARERLRASPYRSFRNLRCHYRHGVVIRAGCELL
jgi:hypothetical protein